MRVRLEKQNGAYAECKFQCGIEFVIVLYAPDDPSQSYELYVLDSVDDIPDDLDDLDHGLMEYAYETFKANTRVNVFYYESYTVYENERWFDIWTEVYDRDDHYELDVSLRETIMHYV